MRLEGEIAHQLSRVLRMRPGEEILLLDGLGTEYRVVLEDVARDSASGRVVGRSECCAEASCRVAVCLALLNKADKYEWALQKGTELGAARFHPVQTERSVPSPPEKGRRERWERIIREAAEQSGRCVLPTLDDTLPFDRALSREVEQATANNHLAILTTGGATRSLREMLAGSRPQSVSIFVGPEGGFSEREIGEAREQGAFLVGLGPRTLRAETAAVTSLALVLYELGEMNPNGGNPEC